MQSKYPNIPSGDTILIRRLTPFLVTAITFTVFLPALKSGFVNWDDTYNIVENPYYRGLGWQQLKWMFTTILMGPYQPLSWITLGMDYLVWGMNPFGYHLTNVVLHSINALVFYFLCAKLLTLAARVTPSSDTAPAQALAARTAPAEKEPRFYFAAGFAALFFAIHPLRVESVAWVTERRDVLSGLFYLLTILWYISPRAAGDKRTSYWRRHVLPLTAFLLALLSKGITITLPAALLLLDIYPLKRLPGSSGKWFSRESRQVLLEKIPFFVLAAVFGVIGYVGQVKTGNLAAYQQFDLAPRAAQTLFAVFFYIQKTVIPFDLSPFYKLPGNFGLLNPQVLLAGFVITAITATAIALRRRHPAGLAVWIYYLVTLSPTAGIIKIGGQSAADRYTYLPCLGFAILAGAGLQACRQAAGKRFRNICAILACSIITGLACLTWRQEGVWQNSEALWTHALAINPELDIAHYNLGRAMNAQGRTDQAIARFREALRINPGLALAHYNLGFIMDARGNTDEAVWHYRETLRLTPDFAEAHNNLGIIAGKRGELDEAAWHFLESLKIDPNHAEAHNNFGSILGKQGRFEEAAARFREALRINPGLALAHYHLGIIVAMQGKNDEAAEHFHEASRLDPAIKEPSVHKREK